MIGKGIEIYGAQRSRPIVIIEGLAKITTAAALHHWFASIPCHLLDEDVEALHLGGNLG